MGMADPKAPKLTPEEEAAAQAQAAADAKAREVAGAPPAEADKPFLAGEPDSPTGSGARYVVLHGAVGEWPQGTVVSTSELEAANVDKVQMKRLLDLGAIEPQQATKD
jgi:hypothetical protein